MLGDFNSRVGKLNDFIITDEFLTNVKQCNSGVENNDIETFFDNVNIPLDRTVKDFSNNNFGYKMIDFCINNNVYIVNGRVGGDRDVGALTCKNTSTVDYVLASMEMFKLLRKFDILEFCEMFSE